MTAFPGFRPGRVAHAQFMTAAAVQLSGYSQCICWRLVEAHLMWLSSLGLEHLLGCLEAHHHPEAVLWPVLPLFALQGDGLG